MGKKSKIKEERNNNKNLAEKDEKLNYKKIYPVFYLILITACLYLIYYIYNSYIRTTQQKIIAQTEHFAKNSEFEQLRQIYENVLKNMDKNDFLSAAQFNRLIAETYYQENKIDKSLKYYLLAYNCYEKMNDVSNKRNILPKIISFYTSKNDSAAAAVYAACLNELTQNLQ